MPFNAELLKLVREQREMTQAELAEALDIKQALVSKFEREVAGPTDEMVKKIAECTGYPASFFSQQVSVGLNGLVYHRKRTALSAAKRSAIEAEGKLRALEAKAVCEKLGRGSDVLTRNERTPEEMACAIREYWQVPPRTIENLVALLENHGVITWGNSVQQAVFRMEAVEHQAKIYAAALELASNTGKAVRYFSEDERNALVRIRERMGVFTGGMPN